MQRKQTHHRLPPLLVTCLLLSALNLVHGTLKNETWYKRYPAYPPYCSTPEEMKTRAIPPLNDDSRLVGETRILHATAIIRHGARTPWTYDLDCWDGYNEDPDMSVWDCDLKTFLSPPSPHEIDIENGEAANNPGSDAMFLFRKQYDALSSPENNLTNYLNGTCQQGQLLLQGFDQELANGIHLRNAYVYDGSSFDHDPRMRLLDVNDPNVRPYEEPTLTYRSDDDQRTLMSGQILLRGLFGSEFVQHLEDKGKHPIIPLHTADRGQDVVDPNEYLCPRLSELRAQAEASVEFQNFNTSQEAQTLRHFMEEELGHEMWDTIDCLMTTMCTDRKLPDALNDYGGPSNNNHSRSLHHIEYGSNLFERIYNFSIAQYVFHMRYNDAAYSKLAMAPLWAEIMDNINPIITQNSQNDRPPPSTRLALFSGHDTTIMPLLATLGERVWDGTMWTPYASMMILEIHDVNIDGQTDRSVFHSDYAFRLLYNGKVLTSLVDGCPEDSDLCDATILLTRVSPFAKRSRDCVARQKSEDTTTAIQHAESLLSSPQGVFIILIVVVMSGMLGGFVMFAHLTGRIPAWCNRKRRGRQILAEAEGAGLQLSEETNGRYQDSPEVETALTSKPPTNLLT